MATMLIPLLAAFGGTTGAKVAPIELENLVRLSDLIVVGEVIDIRDVAHESSAQARDVWSRLPEDLPIADVRVDQVIKGPAGITRVLFVAAGSWTCDTTTAVRGETALYFLHRNWTRRRPSARTSSSASSGPAAAACRCARSTAAASRRTGSKS
jgi:hypothetical protein